MAELGVLNPFPETFGGTATTSDMLALGISHDDDIFRPSIADDQKIGFFRLDRSTQTEVSQIVEIKELSDNVHQLLEDAQSMRRDINFAQSVMQADFEGKLQQKAIDMYVRVNEKVSEIEKMQEERVNTVRRAFKQQLSDAIARMHALYQQDFASKLEAERSKKDTGQTKWEKRYREQQKVIAKNEGIIAMLKEQIEDYQNREVPDDTERVFVWSEAGTETKPSTPEQVIITKTPSPDLAKEQEIDDLRDQVMSLEDDIHMLKDKVHDKDETIDDLRSEIDHLTDDLEKERVMIDQQKSDMVSLRQKVYSSEKKIAQMAEEIKAAPDEPLKYEMEEVSSKNEQDQAAGRRMMENAKLAQAKEMEEHIHKMKQQLLIESHAELEAQQTLHNERVRQLTYEKKMLEELLAKAKSEGKARSKDQDEMERVQRNEQRLVNEVAKLKREIDRVHRTWEKKFAILQQSLHALKDESYLRQTLQRQAVQLHQAAISYSYDSPLGIAPTNQKPMSVGPPAKKPLPDIKGQRVKSPGADYISYTVSAPSGRATTLFSIADENQVMSEDDQDFPSDVKPLPSPPPREHSVDIDSRPSTVKSKSSHVVILPTTNDHL